MSRIWLKSYPPGVPAEIDPTRLRSLKELLERTCAAHADEAAYVQMGKAITYRQLDELSRNFAAWLQKAGFKKGDRMAIMLPNTLQYPIAMFGALRAGLAVVNTNPLYTAPELEHQLADSGATVMLVLENFAHVLEAVLPRTKVKQVLVTAVGDFLSFPKSWIVNYVIRHRRKQVPRWQIEGALDFKTAVAAGHGSKLTPVEVGPDDLAYLQYTGGTTGVSKGTMLTHGNVSSNVLQAEAWIGQFFRDKPGVLITPIPLYHIFALMANCLLFARLGWKNVLIINPRDFPAVIAEMKKYPFAFISGVNTLFNALLHAPGFDKLDFSHLKITLGGGMAVQAAVAQRWKDVTGHVLTQAWGLTETSPAACINPPTAEYNGSIGLPISSTEISIKDDAGKDLDLGQVGEICVRGPQVMRGYWNRPDETAKVMLPGDWLRTGDVGRMDERGFVYIEDRKKDMILVSGFNVYPNEVEAVAVTHPGILEAAAVAQQDEHSGEVVALYVVRKDPALTDREVIDFCRKSLAAYKVPKHVYFRPDLPKSNVGKILRKALRDELTHSSGK
ncbi:MAG: long-chain-fatty-acid--CoA ligase [Gammaproteobacteria bacterium]|jgi:long-chain acyl-CoA synthetase|nr:long-chain-fatty-acid--CoA ligase [Gammaproteobacteria bacterium]